MRVTNNLTDNIVVDIVFKKKGNNLISEVEISELDLEGVGSWGIKHKNYLMSNDIESFDMLIKEGKLNKYLKEINKRAETKFKELFSKTSKAEGVNLTLKKQNNSEWLRRKYSAEASARRAVDREFVFVLYNKG